MLTPFDRLDGFERRMQQRQSGRSADQASTSGDEAASSLPSRLQAAVRHEGAFWENCCACFDIEDQCKHQNIAEGRRCCFAGRGVEPPFRRVAEQLAAIEAGKHRSRLVDPCDLPRRERGAPRINEMFWRQAASGKDAPPAAKQRRRQTLSRARRRRPSLPGPGKRCAACDRSA